MKSPVVQTLLVVVTLVGFVGCQSGPRWAWWKRDTAPDDASLVARSAAPTLPSTQASPQPVATAATAPPSSANLAAVGAATTSPPTQVPASSAPTIASAPLAAYPGTATPVAPYPTTSSGTSSTLPTNAATAQAGPYNPNAYLPAASPIAGQASGENQSADRYALTPSIATPAIPTTSTTKADRYAATPDQYAPYPAPPVTATTSSADRYGTSAIQPYAAAASSTQGVADGTNAATPVASAPLPAPSPATSGTVQLTSAPGQYRPGGTSSYVAGSFTGQIEVASRPEPAIPIAPTTTSGEAAIGRQALPPAPAPAGDYRYGTY